MVSDHDMSIVFESLRVGLWKDCRPGTGSTRCDHA